MNYIIFPGLKIKKIKTLNTDNIIQSVCDSFHTSLDNIKRKKRKRELVTARHLCYYFLRKYTDNTLKEIGFFFNTDHTTVIHGCNKIEGFLEIKEIATLDNICKIEGLLDEIKNPIYS